MKAYFTKTNIIIILAISLVAWFFLSIQAILTPFVLAFVFAYILHPTVTKLERCHVGRFKCGRGGATGIVVVGFCLTVVAVLLMLVPLLQAEVFDFMMRIPQFSAEIWNRIKPVLTATKESMTTTQIAELSDAVSQSVRSVLSAVGGSISHLLSGGMAVFNTISLIVITPIVLFYVLRDWKGIQMQVKDLIPDSHKEQALSVWQEINRTLSGFIRGQAVVCLLLGLFYGIGLVLVGLEYGVLIGLLAGLLSFIPYVGFGVGLVLSLLLAFMQGFSGGQWVGLAVVFILGQILEGYVLTPFLVGNKVGLHPLWVMFAILAGGVLAGFVGVLIAVPVAAVIGVLIRRGLAWYRKTPFYTGKNNGR